MMTRTSLRLVERINLREVSGSSRVATPAAASSGTVSSKMRPLESAIVIMGPERRKCAEAEQKGLNCNAKAVRLNLSPTRLRQLRQAHVSRRPRRHQRSRLFIWRARDLQTGESHDPPRQDRGHHGRQRL